MGNHVLKERHGEFTLTLEYDEDCRNPLDDYAGQVFITYRAGARTCIGNTPLDQEAHEDIARRIESGELVGLPVYCYQHGGIALSTGPFSCPWDSGQSGFIYCTKRTALDWQGGKVLTAKKRAAVLKALEGVVSGYGEWINGECYGYTIERDGEPVNSCWGFIRYEYAEKEARSALSYVVKAAAEKAALWNGINATELMMQGAV